ncbi:exo-alpha-sialidase [Niastella caeni]|uniref:Exo-alpha-sialidase n=1 Tax=Niastella caeni TaxID=2569763 RepID=A0A4S8HY35_9BACT|nr:sialidase family protein [Niastella caeni]THU38142.1 exo-alpha-sialidase [Niastella caeni]
MEKKYSIKILLLASAWIISANAFSQSYTWKNVKIGGGGFVSGLIFHPSQNDLLYARTDVGGAYRWNAVTSNWIPITDFMGQDDENYSGVLSIATDPNDVNRVYMATGLYTAWWAGNAAVFSSTDKGSTWTRHNLTIKLGGNEDGRNSGERLAVDPNLGSILYLGSSKDGLWKSTDYGSNWSKVNSFPVSTFSGAGVSFVLFDKSTGTTGNATQTIYVGIMQTGTNLYKSTDGGVTWSAVPGQPTTLMPLQGVLASNGTMYITYADNPGPSNITTGAVYKLITSTNTFTALTLPAGQGGFSGVSVDASNANTVVVSTMDRWWPRDEIFRSTDGGNTWTALLTSATWNQTSAPYTTGYTAHWIADVEIDPFDNTKAWFVTGYGVFQTTNISAAPVSWTFQNAGLEEMVSLSLASPASGVPLLSAEGDHDGFRHVDVDISPVAGKFSPSYSSNGSIDVGQTNTNYVVRTYNNSSGNYGAYSTNQGAGWTIFGSYPAGTTGGGSIALSANAATIVWSPDGAAVSYSTNNGTTWTAATGISSGQAVTGDKVNSNKFYGYNATTGICHVSTNGGVSFSDGATGLPLLQSWELWMAQTRSVFGVEGDVWLTSGYNGLYHSVNSGASFTKITGVDAAYKVAFGMAAGAATYPAIYIQGRVGGTYGFYRSIDGGSTWARINDDAHNFLAVRSFTADPKIYGRVYIGTSGRGIIYGDDATALPVLFSSVGVSARNVSNTTFADVKWTTASERNVAYFAVERTTDTIQWKEVGRVNSNQLRSYKYSDDITALNGTLFYRIKEVDYDNRVTYSSVVSLRRTAVSYTKVNVWPNPPVGNIIKVNISSPVGQNVVIRLLDASGRIMYSSSIIGISTGNNIIELPAVQFTKGNIAFIEILNATNSKQIEVIKFIN